MGDLITLQAAADKTGSNTNTLHDWISRGIIPRATRIESRGKAGGRKGYYPATIIPEIETAQKMLNDGLSRKTIARARALALKLMADPTVILDANEIANVGLAARQWLDIYAGITEAPAAQKALVRLEADLSNLVTLVIRGLRYHMVDIIDRLPDVMATEKE
jgi:DNA-binding transcriptional MerR regulator